MGEMSRGLPQLWSVLQPIISQPEPTYEHLMAAKLHRPIRGLWMSGRLPISWLHSAVLL